MRNNIQRWFILACGLLIIAGCGGSSGGSTGNARSITGTLASSSAALSGMQAQTAACGADTVIATDTTGAATSAVIADDCSFSITLTIGASYVISFVLDGSFVATLIFDSGITGFSSSALPLSAGSADVSLGTVTISGNVAIPAQNPLGQVDSEGDGIPDLDDDDDDNDGISDDLEDDCDLDGFLDDHDNDNDDCEESEQDDGENAKVKEVKPRNDPHPDLGNDTVDLDKDVRARISCIVDQASVTAETFHVESDGDSIACQYKFSGTGQSGNRIECDHDSQPFLPNTVYTATIDGVLCEDGRSVTSRSWSWLTEAEDDDEGDAEDDLDDDDDDDDDDEDEDDS